MTTSQISDCRRGIPSVRTERNAVWCWYSRPCPTSFAHLGFRPTTPPSRLPEKIDLWSRMLPKQVRFGGQVSDICQLSGCTRAPSLRVVVQLCGSWRWCGCRHTNPSQILTLFEQEPSLARWRAASLRLDVLRTLGVGARMWEKVTA